MLFREKHITARNGSLAYIRSHLGSFEAAGVRDKLLTLRKKFSKPSKSLLITSLGLAQALRVLVIGLALERVRE
jgi:hypothetical protein